MQNGWENIHQITNNFEATPLHLAIFCISLKPATLDMIINQTKNGCNPKKAKHVGVDLNAVDKDGHSILHYALLGKRSDLKLVQHLVFHGADMHIKDKENRSSADICRLLGLTEHYNFLSTLGCQTSKMEDENESRITLFDKLFRLFQN